MNAELVCELHSLGSPFPEDFCWKFLPIQKAEVNVPDGFLPAWLSVVLSTRRDHEALER